MRRWWIGVVVSIGILLLGASGVAAHANLERADPAPNAHLATPPEAFHLWFTEPVEPSFSRIELRDSSGSVVVAGVTEVVENGHQMVLRPGDLADGVYTVAWRVVSATDGHPTTGSYPITIGAGFSGVATDAVTSIATPVPAESAVVRWLNLMSLALLGGLPAFVILIFRIDNTSPASQPEGKGRYIRLSRALWVATWIGWFSVGITSILLLLLQSSILIDGGVRLDAVAQTAFETRFGTLWLIRIGYWMAYGLILMLMRNPYRLLIILAGATLLLQSLFSHASGVEQPLPFIVTDWLHLVGMSAWIGGLVGLAVSIPFLRAQPGVLGGWVARFSNLARVAVLLLVVTGVIAGLEHVGTVEALTTTPYGVALIIKLLLFLPLIGIAAVNLLLTSRGLRAGKEVWSSRLRVLVGGEILLAIAIMGAVGVMTAIPPAKVALAARQTPPPPPDSTFFSMEIEENTMVHLTITPGLVGENTFVVDLLDEETGEPVDDASLIRIRFTHQTEDLGESELRPEFVSDGQYTVVGSNLSVPGDWLVRVSVQRPGQFDAVVDFEPHIPTAEELAARSASPTPAAATSTTSPDVSAASTFPAETPVTIVVARDGAQPWLLTQGGTLLRPSDDAGSYEPVAFDSPIRDAYFGLGNILWAATDAGLYRLDEDVWEQIGDFPARHILSTHGYVFALGDGGILRAGEGGIEVDVRQIDAPLTDTRASELVMLGNHTHVLLNGSDVYQTSSLGLGWKPLDAPEDVIRIAVDGDGNLLSITPDALLTWNWTTSTWETRSALTDGTAVDAVTIFDNVVYVLSDGGIMRLMRDGWQPVVVSADPNSVMTDLAFQFPDTLWVLDAEGKMLYSTHDGQRWEMEMIN